MRSVYLNHVKPTVSAQSGRLFVRPYNLQNHLSGHLLHFTIRHMETAWTVCSIRPVLIASDTYQSTVHSSMRKLNIRICSCMMYRLNRLCQPLSYPEGIQLQLFVMRLSRSGMYNRFPISHHTGAAFCLFLQISDHFRSKMSLCRDHTWTGWRCDDPVLQADIPDTDRFKKMRIFLSSFTTSCSHNSSPFC